VTQVFKSNAVDLGNLTVRLGQEPGWVEMADNGAVGTSSISIDNTGSVVVAPWKTLTVDELAISGNTRTYTGTAIKRTYRRGDGSRPSLRTGAYNQIDVDLNDLNELLGRKTITGTDGNRPAETVSTRLTWLLASAYLTGLVYDNGFVAASAISLPATDYTGQNAASVVMDLALAAHFNHFVYPDPTTNQASLWFDDSNTSSNYDSGKYISNVLSDLDNAAIVAGTATVFEQAGDWSVESDPTRCYSGVYLPYAKGFKYLTDATIATTFTARDGSAPNANVKTDAQANTVAINFLADNATEDVRINCTIRVAAKQANAIKAGQLVQYKNSAIPAFTTYQPCRVLQRALSQPEETDQFYQIPLVLSPATPTPVLTCTWTNWIGPSTPSSDDVWGNHLTGTGFFAYAGTPPTATVTVSGLASAYGTFNVSPRFGMNAGVFTDVQTFDARWAVDLGSVKTICKAKMIGQAYSSGSLEYGPSIAGPWTTAIATLNMDSTVPAQDVGNVAARYWSYHYTTTQGVPGFWYYGGEDVQGLLLWAAT
jgi:hypothetical protein